MTDQSPAPRSESDAHPLKSRRQPLREYDDPAGAARASLSAQDLQAAAAVHQELGPEYSDAVVTSFLDRIDTVIAGRIQANLAQLGHDRSRVPARPDRSGARVLLTAIGTGAAVTGLPLTLTVLWFARNRYQDHWAYIPAAFAIWVVITASYLVAVARSIRQRD